MQQSMIFSTVTAIHLTIALLHAAAPPDTDAGKEQKQIAASSSAIDAAVRPLPFRPGDALLITTYPDSAGFPSGFYPIDGEGYADFPIIGYVKVTGMSADELAKLLADKYVDFMRYPHMSIRPLIRVALNGGFYRPGLYWLNPHSTLWQTVQIAGGTQRMDGFKMLKWERDRKVLNNDLVHLLQEGKSLYQIGFRTGDQITVIQQPQRTGWEIFRSDVLPVLSFTISTAVSVVSLYNTFMLYDYYRSSRR